MTTALLISLRETLEASLIVGIVLGFLQREGALRAMRFAWLGVGVGIALSILVAYALRSTASTLTEKQEEIFEGVLMLFASGMLLWTLLWLHRHSANMGGRIIATVENHLSEGAMVGIFLLCCTAVAREGIEMAIFIQATLGTASTPIATLTGTLLGIAGSTGLTVAILRGMRGLSLRLFFRISTFLLLCIGFGLAMRGIGELQEARLLPFWSSALWDTSHWLSHASYFGHIAQTLVGYESNPTGAQLFVGTVYLSLAASLLFLKQRATASSSM